MTTMHSAGPDDAAEREWQAQERALREERLALDRAGDDARVQRYRLVARALREPPSESLPADFAARVARLAGAAVDPRFERFLIAGGVAAFVLIGLGSLVADADSWRQALPIVAELRNGWIALLALCVGGSFALDLWRRRRAR